MKFIRFLLFPFAIIYNIITTIRNFLYNNNVLKSHSFKTPIIVVGNLSLGGTGKTPMIEYLVRCFKDSKNIAILSRGYKRKTKGFLLINSSHSYKDSGDEPMQFFKKFSETIVAVDENRARGIYKLINLKKPDIIFLDDAYQHRKVQGSFYILLSKYNDLFTNDFLLPTGNLRESRRGAKRANAIVVTKCPLNLSISAQNKIKKQLEIYKKPVFFTSIKYSKKLKGLKETITVDNLVGFQVLLITGIANPLSLLSFLKDKNINYIHLEFSDHHHFSTQDITNIHTKFNALQSKKKLILTTEKDFIRLHKHINNIAFIEIETTFLNKEEFGFNKLLQQKLKI